VSQVIRLIALLMVKLLFLFGGCCLVAACFVILVFLFDWPIWLLMAITLLIAGYVCWITWHVLRENKSPSRLLKARSRHITISVVCFFLFYLVTFSGLIAYGGLKGTAISWFLTRTRVNLEYIDDIRSRSIHNAHFPGDLEILSNFLRLSIRKNIWSGKNSQDAFEEPLFDYTVVTPAYTPLITVFREQYIEKDYYFSSTREDPFIIDCGSNIGISILFFKHLYPKSKILGIEADPTTIPFLKKNISVNHLENVTLLEGALSNTPGTITFYSAAPGAVVNSTVTHRGKAIEVEAILLSDYIEEEVDFLKIDIEGAEPMVIQNLFESGKIRLIKKMVVEYDHHLSAEENSFSQILSWLEKSNFEYQINAPYKFPFSSHVKQNFLIYAYRK